MFEPGDYLFAWDLKGGYCYIDLHPPFWTCVAFVQRGGAEKDGGLRRRFV